MKTLVITGGSDGLGKTLAERLSSQYKVVILARSEEKLRAIAEKTGCTYHVCDVRDHAQVEKVMKAIGTIDCLINNAGMWLQGPLDETDPARIREVIEVNTLGPIHCTRAVMPAMKAQGSGLIINIVSQAGLYGRAGWPVYAASKWAMTGFTQSMQQELEPFGIRVTGVYPGTFQTDLFAKADDPRDVSHGLNTTEVAEAVEFVLTHAAHIPEIGIKPFRKSK